MGALIKARSTDTIRVSAMLLNQILGHLIAIGGMQMRELAIYLEILAIWELCPYLSDYRSIERAFRGIHLS